jgi:hypothetical protein
VALLRTTQKNQTICSIAVLTNSAAIAQKQHLTCIQNILKYKHHHHDVESALQHFLSTPERCVRFRQQ